MPRPDLAAIDVGYRKIPIMAIGKDVYCDSRLILSKLESVYPESTLSPSTPAEGGLRKLFENYATDGGIFGNAVKLIPFWHDNGLLKNEVFLNDRQKLMGGRRMTAEAMEAGRPDGLQHLRQAFHLLETTFLADGRDWILATQAPSLADIDAVWPFEWLMLDPNMKDALPEAYVSAKIFPKTFAWVNRFMAFVEKSKSAHPKPISLDGKAMAQRILDSTSTDEIGFIRDDPLKLQQGDEVEIFPSDYGQTGKTVGQLIGLTTNEVTIRNSKGLHVHFPRWNFSIKKRASTVPATAPTSVIPKMRLIYHPFSPYTRKVFMFAHEVGLAKHITLQKVVVCPVNITGWSDDNDKVSVFNPMAKIPCLVPEDVPEGVFDSRIICEYLATVASISAKKTPRYWQLRTLHACADGIMDAAVLITYEVRIRKERNLYFDEWMEGQKQKMLRGLDRFEAAAQGGILPNPGPGPASADEVAVVVATAMTSQMPFLSIDWKAGRPKLEEWMNKWEQRASFVATPPTQDWIVEGESKSLARI